MRLEPRWPHTQTTPWSDCACNDLNWCVYHQVHWEDRPERPSDEEMMKRAEKKMEWQRENWEEYKRKFELASRALELYLGEEDGTPY